MNRARQAARSTLLRYASLAAPVFGAEPHPARVGLTAGAGVLAIAQDQRLRLAIVERQVAG